MPGLDFATRYDHYHKHHSTIPISPEREPLSVCHRQSLPHRKLARSCAFSSCFSAVLVIIVVSLSVCWSFDTIANRCVVNNAILLDDYQD
ncbi:unnamed protein product [Macrosiphum euphorbiae]|uniref:Uncharacterized protein n=1 Tax=Macrosiphum euphorbiae TaxID=13131 RepID=A0AAV0WEB4_9HEMI|nr:unnamed protein product [Macrosiphum euphorbiae]